MNQRDVWTIFLGGLLIPLLGTISGAGMVLIMRRRLSSRAEKLLLGFAAGVMLAASFWSLIVPSIEMSKDRVDPPWIPASIGFTAGIFFLLLLDSLIPHLHLGSSTPEGVRTSLGKQAMMVLAVTLHNIPEGMAVGVMFAGAMQESVDITMAGALALAVGMAMQNFPEGAIISLPLHNEGISRRRAFGLGVLSGIVEPVAAILTLCLAAAAERILPYLLAFAAGAMIYVVLEELIPESQNGVHSNAGTVGAAAGFLLMMILDLSVG